MTKRKPVACSPYPIYRHVVGALCGGRALILRKTQGFLDEHLGKKSYGNRKLFGQSFGPAQSPNHLRAASLRRRCERRTISVRNRQLHFRTIFAQSPYGFARLIKKSHDARTQCERIRRSHRRCLQRKCRNINNFSDFPLVLHSP